MTKIKALLDNWMSKVISKKLLVFLICTIAMFMGLIISGDWVEVAMAYIGSQAVIDAVKEFKNDKKL